MAPSLRTLGSCIAALILTLGAFHVAAPSPAAAEAAAKADAALCERAIAHGARVGGVPEAVLHAVALTETGRALGGRLRPWPWAINREGEGHWFATRDQALAFARRSLSEGRPSFDVGCFQINFRWHGRHFPSLEAMADPETGAVYAARFLRALYAELGSWSAAAGAYHSRTPHLARRYRARFDGHLARVAGGASPLLALDEVTAAVAEARPAAGGRTIRRVRAPRIITIVPGEGPVEAPDAAAIAAVEAEGRIIRLAVEPAAPAPAAAAEMPGTLHEASAWK